MRNGVVQMQSAFPMASDSNPLKPIVSELDFNNYRKAYPAIMQLSFQLDNPVNSPDQSDEVFVQTVQKEGYNLINGPALLEKNKEEIGDLLDKLQERKAFTDMNRAGAVGSLQHLGFFYRVLDYLYDNPLNPKFMDYAYETFGRLRYSAGNVEQSDFASESQDRRDLIDSELEEAEYGPSMEPEMPVEMTTEMPSEVGTQLSDEERMENVQGDLRAGQAAEQSAKSVSQSLNTQQINDILQSLRIVFDTVVPDTGQDLATALNIQDPIRNIKSVLQNELEQKMETAAPSQEPLIEPQKPTIPSEPQVKSPIKSVFDGLEDFEGSGIEPFSDYSKEGQSHNVQSLIRLADFLDKVNPKIAQIVDEKIIRS